MRATAYATLMMFASGCIDLRGSDAVIVSPGDKPCGAAGSGKLAWVCPETNACDQLAPDPGRIRIVDWNIKAATAKGIDSILQLLRDLDPEIVVLQEVDSNVDRSGYIDEPRVLAESLGADYKYAYAPTLTIGEGFYGIATLSRLTFLDVAELPLSNEGVGETRTAIDTLFCAGRRPFRVVNHHADYQKSGAATSTGEILDTYIPTTILPSVFAGDYNQTPGEPGPSAFVEAGLTDVIAEHGEQPTFGADRIDYFFVNPVLADRVADAKVVASGASDHSLLVMDLRSH